MTGVMIGIDPHKGSNTVVVLDGAENVLGQVQVIARGDQLDLGARQVLIRDHDVKFTSSFDAVIADAGIEILRSPPGHRRPGSARGVVALERCASPVVALPSSPRSCPVRAKRRCDGRRCDDQRRSAQGE